MSETLRRRAVLAGIGTYLPEKIVDVYKRQHASGAIAGDMKPTIALRMRDSSMRRAIDAVQHNEAAGVISAGNTGALLALSKIVLKMCIRDSSCISRTAYRTLVKCSCALRSVISCTCCTCYFGPC